MDYTQFYNTIMEQVQQQMAANSESLAAKSQSRPNPVKGLGARATQEAKQMVDKAPQESYNPAEAILKHMMGLKKEEEAIVASEGTGPDTVEATATKMPRSRASVTKPSDVGNRLMKDIMSELGVSKEVAAGIVGSGHYESGGFSTLQEIDPLVKGSKGGFGYMQWTGPRRVEFEAYAKARGLSPDSYEANKDFFIHEIKNTEEGKVLAALKDAKTPTEASYIFSETYLRPKPETANYAKRGAYAEAYYQNNPSNEPRRYE